MWLAELDGQIVAGAWCFYWNRHVVYWHGAALTAIRSVGATDALIDHVIQDACEHGYEIFDFNPSGGHAGVAAFKRHFGASELPTRIVVHEGRLLSALRQLRQWKN